MRRAYATTPVAVEHVRLCTGSEIGVDPAGEIELRLADATRTLVHAKE